MNTKVIKAALVLVASLTASVVLADHERIVLPDHTTAEPEVRYRGPYITPYVAVGLGAGGDEIGRFRDGYGDEETVRSGGGFLFEGGLAMALDPLTQLRFTGGYELDTVSRSNGHSTFDRFRFDLMLSRQFGATEWGVGLTSHNGVGYRCDINTICAGDVEFDPAVGFTAEFALTMSGFDYGGSYDSRTNPMRGARLGVRYTDIEYRPKLDGITASDLVNGNALTAFVGFAW